MKPKEIADFIWHDVILYLWKEYPIASKIFVFLQALFIILKATGIYHGAWVWAFVPLIAFVAGGALFFILWYIFLKKL